MNNTVLERIFNVATELYMTNGKKIISNSSPSPSHS